MTYLDDLDMCEWCRGEFHDEDLYQHRAMDEIGMTYLVCRDCIDREAAEAYDGEDLMDDLRCSICSTDSRPDVCHCATNSTYPMAESRSELFAMIGTRSRVDGSFEFLTPLKERFDALVANTVGLGSRLAGQSYMNAKVAWFDGVDFDDVWALEQKGLDSRTARITSTLAAQVLHLAVAENQERFDRCIVDGSFYTKGQPVVDAALEIIIVIFNELCPDPSLAPEQFQKLTPPYSEAWKRFWTFPMQTMLYDVIHTENKQRHYLDVHPNPIVNRMDMLDMARSDEKAYAAYDEEA